MWTVLKKIKALKIDIYALKDMSEEEIVQDVLDGKY